MPNTPTFDGFSEPKSNYYILPNSWFFLWQYVRKEYGNRFSHLLKMVEYILKHAWGTNKYVQLSANEIHSGRRSRRNKRMDTGTGISENSVRKASDFLAKIGVLIVEQDQKDKARRLRTYYPKMKEEANENVAEQTAPGFAFPTTNYFKIPKVWTDITRKIKSGALILTVEYFFRHAWGFQNPNGVWLTAEEIANGRKYSNGKRYDSGTGFAVATIQRALREAIKLGLIVWIENYEYGITTRLYNLRFQGVNVTDKGQVSEDEDFSNEVVSDDKSQEFENPRNEPEITNEEVTDDKSSTKNANEERSLKDTPLDTLPENSLLTPSTPLPNVQSNRAHSADVDKKTKKQTPELPSEIKNSLQEIGWADAYTEIEKAYQKNPRHVSAWLDHTKTLPQKEIRKSRAGFFRHGLRSGASPPKPPAPKKYHDFTEDDSEFEDSDDQTTQNPKINADPKLGKTWETVLSQLEGKMPRSSFNTWLKDTYPLSLEEGILQVQVHNADAQDWLDNRVKSTAENILIGVLNSRVVVQFIARQE